MKKCLMPKLLMIATGLIFAMFFLIQTGSTEVPESKTMIIEGVGRLQWGKGMESTYIGALTVAMNAIGEDVTYDYLMGISGAAFRLHRYGWCPSAPDASVGFNHANPAMRVLGYKIVGIPSSSEKPEDVEKVRKAVMESIDRGYPVLAIDLKEVPDWGVIVGYADGGKEFLCRTYYDKTEECSKAEKWPWVVDIIKEKTDKPDTKESILKSLEIAVEVANTEKYGNYFSGFAAYEDWIINLLDDSTFESIDREKLGSMTHANAWSYSSLIDAREAAVKYLHSITDNFGKESTQHLTKAAEIYEKIVAKLKEGSKYAPYPWQLKDGEQWTAEMRHAEAGVLKEVLALERKANGRLRAALKWEDEVTGQVRPDSLTRLSLYNLELPDIPYCDAGVPSAFVQALKHNGIETDYAELTAVSGWAFSFSYKYDNWHVAALPVEDFTFLPEHLGYSVESIRCGDRDKLWDFIKRNIDAGRPVISTHTDGGLIYGYRVKEDKRQLWFDGSICLDWIDIEAPHPLDSCAVLVKSGKEHPQEIAIHDALAQAVEKASPHGNNGVPQGLAALEAYLADVADETKDFKYVGEWFCWGAFERLSARWCCANWLRRAADVFQGEAHDRILAAADYYENAFKLYDQYLQEVQKPDNRSPERIAVAVPILRKAINEERAGIEEMKKALATL